MKNKITLLLAVVFTMGLFANGQQGVDYPSLEEIGFNKSGYPIVESPVDIKIMFPMRPQMKDISDFTIPMEVAAGSGINLDLNGVPMSVYSQKKNLFFASGDLPDVFWGTQSLTKEDLETYGQSGNILRLNEYIDNYMPNLKSILDESPGYRENMMDEEGNIYYLPYIVENMKQPVKGKMFINKKWLDRLGLDVPETVEELYDVLMKFKTSDPNGNGLADEIPLVTADSHYAVTEISSFAQLFGAFGRHGAGFVIENGEVLFAPVEDEYFEAINYFKKFYAQDLVNGDSFFLSVTDYWKVFKTSEENKVGMCLSFGPGDVVSDRFLDDYIPLSPLTGPGGKKSWHRDYTTAFGSAIGAAVNANTPYPEVIVRFLDEFYKPDNSIEVFLGTEGKVLRRDGSGNYSFIEDIDPWVERYIYTPADGPIMFARKYVTSGKAPNLLQESADIYKEYYREADPSYVLPALKYTDEELEVIESTLVDIRNFVLTSRVNWLTTSEPLTPAKWEEYKRTIGNMNIEGIIRAKQEAFDRAGLVFREFE